MPKCPLVRMGAVVGGADAGDGDRDLVGVEGVVEPRSPGQVPRVHEDVRQRDGGDGVGERQLADVGVGTPACRDLGVVERHLQGVPECDPGPDGVDVDRRDLGSVDAPPVEEERRHPVDEVTETSRATQPSQGVGFSQAPSGTPATVAVNAADSVR